MNETNLSGTPLAYVKSWLAHKKITSDGSTKNREESEIAMKVVEDRLMDLWKQSGLGKRDTIEFRMKGAVHVKMFTNSAGVLSAQPLSQGFPYHVRYILSMDDNENGHFLIMETTP